MFPYFPFADDEFKLTMGVRALGEAKLIEVDPDCYSTELALKETLLSDHHTDYFRATAGSEDMQWELLEVMLPRLAHDYPAHFSLTRDGERWTWHNALLDKETTFRIGNPAHSDLLLEPLDWLGRQVQEDLLILDGAGNMPLIAGQLCFPNNWSLADKLGKSFLAIHHEVPLFAEHIGRSSNLLLQRLKAERATWRVNWSIKTTTRLNLLASSPYGESDEDYANITAENAGQRCHLRVERQTLSRLPRTNGILFTVHTYQSPLADITANPEHARRMAAFLRSTPAAMLDYKGITPFLDPLIAYLEMRACSCLSS